MEKEFKVTRCIDRVMMAFVLLSTLELDDEGLSSSGSVAALPYFTQTPPSRASEDKE